MPTKSTQKNDEKKLNTASISEFLKQLAKKGLELLRKRQRERELLNETKRINESYLKALEISRIKAKYKVRNRSLKLKDIRKMLNNIHAQITLEHSKPFPKSKDRLISSYEYTRKKIKFKKGRIVGSELKVLISLVDFTFIRSLVSDCYSKEGGKCHDPVTIFLLELFARHEGRDIKNFIKTVNDGGDQYRKYAGLPDGKMISEGTFTNLRDRIGEEKYAHILNILVQIMTQLKIITGRIISVDGTLIPTNSRYKGCTYACEKCRCIGCSNVFQKVKERVEEICSDPADNRIGRENRIFIECPNPLAKIPKDKKKKISMEVICFIVEKIEKDKPNKAGDALADLADVKSILSKHGLGLIVTRSNIIEIPDKSLFSWNDLPGKDNAQIIKHLRDNMNMRWVKNPEIRKSNDGKHITVTKGKNSIIFKLNEEESRVSLEINGERIYKYILKEENGKLNIYSDNNKDTVFVNCPRIPSDIDAGMGCRRSKEKPDKKEWVFGFNAVILITVEPLTGLELPIAVITIPGNKKEGNEFIPLIGKIDSHNFKTEVYLADSGHDYKRNYEAVRERGACPVIEYNKRKENLTDKAKRARGYDENGWPYAPCGALMKPNGFDNKANRLKFCCFHNCHEALDKSECSNCPNLKKKMGCVKNMSPNEHPRLILEIPRGTKGYKSMYNYRTASERVNSHLKDKCRLKNPLRRGLKNFGSHVLMTCITALLMKVIKFIIKNNTSPLCSKRKDSNRKIISEGEIEEIKRERDAKGIT